MKSLQALSLATALCAVGAMVLMLPLKEIRPYVVMVDRHTGESELVVSTRPADLAETDAVRQAELVRYVTERETYDVADNHIRTTLADTTTVEYLRDAAGSILSRKVDQAMNRRYATPANLTASKAVALAWISAAMPVSAAAR